MADAGTDDHAATHGYDLIVDHYLLSHLDRPRAALATLSGMLEPDGTLVLETDHCLSIVEGCQFDAIRHGHRSYVSLSWLRRELEAVDLHVVDARIEPVYGGALRVWARRVKRGDVGDTVDQRRHDFGARRGGGHRHRRRPRPIRDERGSGAHRRENVPRGQPRGRPPRGRLRRAGAGRDVPQCSRHRPGSPVCHAQTGLRPNRDALCRAWDCRSLPRTSCAAHLPADVLVLAWDLADEIRAGIPWVEEGGGRWLVAVPELAVVGPGVRVPIGA